MKDENTQNKERRFPIGMRTIKTAVATFLCMVIDFLRGEVPFQSVITTAMCIQPDQRDSLQMALARSLGTLMGAIYGVAAILLFCDTLGTIHTLLYYLGVAAMMLPLIFTVTKLRAPGGVIVSIVVFLSITMNHATPLHSWQYAFARIIDTLIGIFVALPVNLLMPGGKPMLEETKENK